MHKIMLCVFLSVTLCLCNIVKHFCTGRRQNTGCGPGCRSRYQQSTKGKLSFLSRWHVSAAFLNDVHKYRICSILPTTHNKQNQLQWKGQSLLFHKISVKSTSTNSLASVLYTNLHLSATMLSYYDFYISL